VRTGPHVRREVRLVGVEVHVNPFCEDCRRLLKEYTISKRNQPEGGQAPIVQRLRIRYAKRGPLRFTSHRDFARAFERRGAARRRTHSVFSRVFAAPEDLLRERGADRGWPAKRKVTWRSGCSRRSTRMSWRRALDAALSPGLDILDVVEARGGNLADRIDVVGSGAWSCRGVSYDTAAAAVEAFMLAG